MKRNLCFILAVLMLLSLCACSSKPNTAETSEKTESGAAVSPNIISTEVNADKSEASGETTSNNTETATVTSRMEKAADTAKNYMIGSCFSRDGLIELLQYDNYTEEEASYGADHCGADWNEQAAEAASAYLECMEFTREELLETMVAAGFTEEEAEYGISQSYK